MKYVVILMVVLITGCSRPAVETKATNNPNVPVSKLFDHEGCAVYRFDDGGRTHYYANCGQTVSTATTYSCGKACVTNEEISTIRN
jgi:hypothetical protein